MAEDAWHCHRHRVSLGCPLVLPCPYRSPAVTSGRCLCSCPWVWCPHRSLLGAGSALGDAAPCPLPVPGSAGD